jgi:dienelactone hydrolase
MVKTHCLPTGSLQTSELPVANVSTAGLNVVLPSPGIGACAVRGVAVMLHGIIGNYSMPTNLYDQANNTTFWNLAQGLNTDGWITIWPQYQEASALQNNDAAAIRTAIGADPTFGANYLADWLHLWDHILIWIQQNYGTKIPVMPVGISWGGWHTLQLAQNRQSQIVGYVCHIPVTVLSALSVFAWNTITTTGADLSTTCLNKVYKPGIAGWGTNDPYTNPTVIENIVSNAQGASPAAPVTGYSTSDTHELLSADVTYYEGWVTSTIDPLCPKVF